MKNKKFLFLSLIAVLGITACGGQPSSPTEPETPTSSEPTTVNPGDPVEPPVYDEDTLHIHYHRPDGIYDGWDLWLWEDGGNGAGYAFNGFDDYGAIASYPLSTWANIATTDLGVLVRLGGDSWTAKDVESDRFVSIADFPKDENNIHHIYLVSGDKTIYDNPSGKDADIINSATFVSSKRIVVLVNQEIESYKFYEDDVVLKEKTFDGTEDNKTMADCDLDHAGDFNKDYTVEIKFKKSGRVLTSEITKQPLFKTTEFDQQYSYDGELGAIYTKDSTTFKVWSPVSSQITLNIYENGTPKNIDSTRGDDTKTSYPMELGEKGVWSVTVDGDLNGKFYTYSVTNNEFDNKECVDPYAKSAGVNGKRGMIIDFNDEKAKPEGWDEFTPNIHPQTSLTVWETHVADVTSSETWTGNEDNRLLFNGMVEKGTTYEENGATVTTGYDHIKELGVNAVQIIPVFDQDNDEVNKSFNWGYNPLNYNVIDGIYSSDPFDGYARVKEFRNVVKTFGEDDINVIMDVVYNHVSSHQASNFNILVPGYYFRYKNGTQISSGSGCGNDTASELPMFRKFIKDSTLFLAQTYKLSGYRFDLMGLHDVKTMNEVVTNLHTNYNEDMIVYGEPWNLTTATVVDLAIQSNMRQWQGFAGFNDVMRDAIKGSVFDATSTGWATNADSIDTTNYDKVSKSILGATPGSSSDPLKAVQYVSCHDNNTLHDKLRLSVEGDDEYIEDLSIFCNSIVLTSQGASFINAGEEFLRAKVNEDGSFNENSYNASYKVNELDYSRKIDYPDAFEQYKNLIYIKQALPQLHYTTSAEINEKVTINPSADKSYIDITIIDGSQELRFIYVSAYAKQNNTLDLSGYNMLYTTKGSEEVSSNYQLSPLQTIILGK